MIEPCGRRGGASPTRRASCHPVTRRPCHHGTRPSRGWTDRRYHQAPIVESFRRRRTHVASGQVRDRAAVRGPRRVSSRGREGRVPSRRDRGRTLALVRVTRREPSGDQEIELGLVTCVSSATSEPSAFMTQTPPPGR